MSNSAYIIDGIRTPFGKYGGSLAYTRPDDLASMVLVELLKRNPQIDPNLIDDVILGCSNQAGEDNRNIARMANLIADLPVSIPGATINRLCGSGLMAVNMACQSILASEGDLYIAGGVESMTRAPFVMAKPNQVFQRGEQIMFDSTLGWRFINEELSKKHYPYSMGETAENVAQKYNISRDDQDEFALNSQLKYAKAHENGKFKNEIIPINVKSGKQIIAFDKDEHPRANVTIDDLKKLKPAFKSNGTVTAGNSSGINDGACVLLIASEKFVEKFNLTPKARYVASSVAGVDPAIMGVGPVTAVNKVLNRTGINIKDIDLIELNEAFAAQSLACIRELKLDSSIINVNGGAIAIGHPLGASGARILLTLINEMHNTNAKLGLASMCIGVGQGISTIVSKV